MVLLVRGWLVHYFCLLGADGEAEVVAGCGKTVHLRLYFLLIAGVEATVVSKEKVAKNSFLHRSNSLQPPGVEQFPIGPIPDVDAKITVPEGVRQHCRENQAEQCRGLDTTLFDSVGHWEGFGWFTIVEDSGHHAVMELADDCDESARAAKFLHDLPEAFPADCIEGLGQVNKGRVKVAMLFHALLLELTSSKDHQRSCHVILYA